MTSCWFFTHVLDASSIWYVILINQLHSWFLFPKVLLVPTKQTETVFATVTPTLDSATNYVSASGSIAGDESGSGADSGSGTENRSGSGSGIRSVRVITSESGSVSASEPGSTSGSGSGFYHSKVGLVAL